MPARMISEKYAASNMMKVINDEANAPMNVNAAIDSALGMLRNELKYRARVERDLRATRAVRGNAARLGQVFLNLLLNAAQALDEANSKHNVVTVRSYDEGSEAVVEISDNGPGIAAEDRARAAQPFARFAPGKQEGSGLGLSLVAAIARLHRGRLELGSNEPGLKVVVELPS